MRELVIEQALFIDLSSAQYRCLARSPGFREDWLPLAQRLCTAFGERPAGVTCPAAVFAQPFGKRFVAVVHVADQGHNDSGRTGGLQFHVLVLPRAFYKASGGDPFLIAESCRPSWQARDFLPTLPWPNLPPPWPSVEHVQQVLKREKDGPTLLGGAQVLVDGGRLVFERPTPDTELVRGLWLLLPRSTRCQLWPASFAFSNELRFDAVVVPRAGGEDYKGYLTEEQAGDYPEGRYELNLQIAAEAGNQRELDALFARRSRAEVWRYGLLLLVVSLLLVTLSNWLWPTPTAHESKPPEFKGDQKPTGKQSIEKEHRDR